MTMDTVGSRLREERRRRGWSQLTLASEAGVGHATVERCEQGSYSPRLENVVALAAALGVDAGWLAFGDGNLEVDR